MCLVKVLVSYPQDAASKFSLKFSRMIKGYSYPRVHEPEFHPVDDESGRRIEGASLELETTVGKKGPGLGFFHIAPFTCNTQHVGVKEDKGGLSQFLSQSLTTLWHGVAAGISFQGFVESLL